MHMEVTDAERLFREEVRTWLNENKPREERPTENQPMRAFDLAWQRKQFEGGWAGISWPVEFGGRGLSLGEQLIWYEEYARVGAPKIGSCFVGLMHGGPTLIAHGTQAQQAFHLPRILKGEVIWCQGFSEPNAGSDLASLRTSAVVDGDHLVVNGSKIWTSHAHLADYQELLVRTTPGGRKHDGISWVICDMKSPGIDVRPILTMIGPDDLHFCQVFYTDVRIPLSNVVGELGQGWTIANSTLGFERGTAFIAEQIQHSEIVEQMLTYAKTEVGPDGVTPLIKDNALASRLAMIRADMAAIRALSYATVSRAGHNNPGPEGSVVRLFFAEAQQRLRRLAIDLLASDGLELSGDEGWTRGYLRSFSRTIAGGTSDVQRNIIGERVLGLPRGPRAQ